MIKSIRFKNYRNLNEKYSFNNILNVIVGKNNSGKTNILEGIKLAFSTITNDYCKINKSDFKESDDNNVIEIDVELDYNAIPTLNFCDENQENKCGFSVRVYKTQSGRFVKHVLMLNGSQVDMDILREDPKLPNLFLIPIVRIEDIYTAGLTTGISTFIDSEEKYKELKNESKEKIKNELKNKTDKFKELCNKFNQNLFVELTDPKISNEKVYIVDGDLEHNLNIGAGYKSIANILLNTLDEKYNIILIDEIENHLHPALIRNLIRELRTVSNTIIISTTHSPVVINELKMEEIIDVSGKTIDLIREKDCIDKLNTFLHPGRNELILADNVVLVEGYTEEILLKYYLNNINYNWTIVNVAGVMFEPYIRLACLLSKKVVVVSDNDKLLSKEQENSERFKNLQSLCAEKNIKLIETENTLETDLQKNGYLDCCMELLKKHKDYPDFYVAKSKKKMEIVEKLIEKNINLTDWHIIKEIVNEFEGN